jgi:hypothetical protein
MAPNEAMKLTGLVGRIGLALALGLLAAGSARSLLPSVRPLLQYAHRTYLAGPGCHPFGRVGAGRTRSWLSDCRGSGNTQSNGRPKYVSTHRAMR